MSESGKVVVTKTKLDELANAINEKAESTGPKTIAELTQTVNNMPDAKNYLTSDSELSDNTSAITAQESRLALTAGDKLSVFFGKIQKWLADLGTLAFKSKVAKADLAADVLVLPDGGKNGQLLRKTVNGHEWADQTERDIYFHVNGTLAAHDIQVIDFGAFSALTNDWNQLAFTGSDFKDVMLPMPCVDVQPNTDTETTIILRYAGVGVEEDLAIFSGDWYDTVNETQYKVSLLYKIGEATFLQYNIVPIEKINPSSTTPSAPADTGSAGTSAAYSRADHTHPKEVYMVTGTTGSAGIVSASATYAEITAAITAGKTVCMKLTLSDSTQVLLPNVNWDKGQSPAYLAFYGWRNNEKYTVTFSSDYEYVSYSLPEMATVNNLNTRLNRTTNVNAADTNYTTYMARGIALSATEQTPTVNGAICLVYG